MKKFTLASLLMASALTFSMGAFAGNNGGYTGPATNTISVAEIQGMNDDTYVILQGNIKQSLGDDMYVFTDGTGSINIEIDEDDWNGQNVGPNDLVIVKGEIDKDGNVIEIDVDEITLANPK